MVCLGNLRIHLLVNCSNTIRYNMYIYIYVYIYTPMLEDDSSLSQGVGYGMISVKKMRSIHFRSKDTSTTNPLKVNNDVDGRNPGPPDIYKALKILG